MKTRLATGLGWLFVGCLAVAAFFSLRSGVRGALTSSESFQWAGSYLVRSNVDPWQQASQNHGSAMLHLGSLNYLHEFYIFLMPLSTLSFQHAAALWCFLSIALSIASIYLLEKMFALPRVLSLSILFLLWMSDPFRTTLQMGQIGILELFILCVVFSTKNSTLRGIALGVSFSAYNFAPVTVSLLWFRRNIRTLVIAATVPIFGLVMTWGMLGGSLRELAFEPFSNAAGIAPSGMADLTSCITAALASWLPGMSFTGVFAHGFGLMVAGIYGYYLNQFRLTVGAQLTLVAVASLFTTPHPMYDYVFLVIPLCYAASKRGAALRYVAVPMIGGFWFMPELFAQLPTDASRKTFPFFALAAATCLLGVLVTYLTWAMIRIESTYDRRQHPRGQSDRRSYSQPQLVDLVESPLGSI